MSVTTSESSGNMTYLPPTLQAQATCPSCAAPATGSKFCSQCGTSMRPGFNRHAPLKPQGRQTHAAPTFATVPPRPVPQPASANLPKELGVSEVLLLRERILLIAHGLLFVGLHVAGICLAIQCFSGYIGDTLTKLCMAGTPLLFINVSAMLCLIPIKGTRQEISRLKNRLAYLRFKHEYGHLLSG